MAQAELDQVQLRLKQLRATVEKSLANEMAHLAVCLLLIHLFSCAKRLEEQCRIRKLKEQLESLQNEFNQGELIGPGDTDFGRGKTDSKAL